MQCHLASPRNICMQTTLNELSKLHLNIYLFVGNKKGSKKEKPWIWEVWWTWEQGIRGRRGRDNIVTTFSLKRKQTTASTAWETKPNKEEHSKSNHLEAKWRRSLETLDMKTLSRVGARRQAQKPRFTHQEGGVIPASGKWRQEGHTRI